jgi:hypothetical protein
VQGVPIPHKRRFSHLGKDYDDTKSTTKRKEISCHFAGKVGIKTGLETS